MSNVGTPRLSAGATRAEELTHLFALARSQNRATRDAAFDELYRYVAGPMRELLDGCLNRQPGRPVSVTEAIHEAVASLFVKWKDMPVNDTGHFRALVVQTVYWKASAQRRANRRLFEAITEHVPDRAPQEHNALERFEEAVEALAQSELARHTEAGSPECESPTPLADVVKARHLIGLDAEATTDAGTPTRPRVPTFEAVGELLKIDPSAANKRYWRALEWLHEHFPDVVPRLPERKKSGQHPKADGQKGGAA